MSNYINLIDKLSNRDKEIINLYLDKYGCNKEERIPLETWLEDWSHANQKLYKLLGNNLILSFPLVYEKREDELKREISHIFYDEIIEGEISLRENYHDFFWDYIKQQDYISEENKVFFNHLPDFSNFISGQTFSGIKIKKPNAKKILQIQPGTKIIKAWGKVIDYFKDDYPFNLKVFEEFKKKYAIIMTEKKITTTFCISIHPMDYITMSDNNSNWQSCMNWIDRGCYHTGTIEMMNANNVLCCYFLNSNKSNLFVFDKETINEETGELIGVWNNKAWRQLFYITKDIVMGGKPYPYASKDITLTILDQIKTLAAENLNWNYTYGPELYQDMIHVNSQRAMNSQRDWMQIEKKNPFKKNIIWDTKAMYNDMLNDSNTKYWCYRNKVEHTKIISISGKAKCLCCNGNISTYNTENDECDEDYNNRYKNTDDAVCEDCLNTKFHCDYCFLKSPTHHYIQITDKKFICEDCANKYIRKCPCCGEIFYIDYTHNLVDNDIFYNDVFFNHFYEHKEWIYNNNLLPRQRNITTYGDSVIRDKELKPWTPDKELEYTLPMETLYICPRCQRDKDLIKHLQANSIKVPIATYRFWQSRSPQIKNVYIINPEIGEKFRFANLEKGTIEELRKAELNKKF